MPNKSFFYRLKLWFYRIFVILPAHRKIKRNTRYYWEDFEKAKKSGDIKEIIKSAIRLNQVLSEFHQRQKDQLSFYKSGYVPKGEHQVSSNIP
jgi:hypothetical protein